MEYALRIGADRHLTFGTPGNNGATPSLIPGLSSDAAGNPDPEVKKHWIKKDDTVIAQVDGEVNDLNTFPGLPLKYTVTGFKASGPANTVHPASDKNHQDFFAFPRIGIRQQVPITTGNGGQQGGFVMSGPATIEYQWKVQIGIQITTGSDSSIIVTCNESWRARASVVARLGMQMARQGEFADPYRLVPIYLRRPEAEEKADQNADR